MARGAGRRTLELIRVKRLSERLFFVLPGRLAFRLLVLLPFQLSPHSNEFLWRERFRFSFRGARPYFGSAPVAGGCQSRSDNRLYVWGGPRFTGFPAPPGRREILAALGRQKISQQLNGAGLHAIEGDQMVRFRQTPREGTPG
jgi:hypothetical protein